MPTMRTQKVVRGGKVLRKKIRVGGRAKRMTPAQKAGLKKAQRASQKPGAKKNRARSMVRRQRSGLDSSVLVFDYADLLSRNAVRATLSSDSRGFLVEFESNGKSFRTLSQSDVGIGEFLSHLDVDEINGLLVDIIS